MCLLYGTIVVFKLLQRILARWPQTPLNEAEPPERLVYPRFFDEDFHLGQHTVTVSQNSVLRVRPANMGKICGRYPLFRKMLPVYANCFQNLWSVHNNLLSTYLVSLANRQEKSTPQMLEARPPTFEGTTPNVLRNSLIKAQKLAPRGPFFNHNSHVVHFIPDTLGQGY